MNSSAVGPTEIVIDPPRGWIGLELRELWEYRQLFYFLAWRDLKVRYKQTALGAAWAILQPFLTMVVFSVFFGRLARLPSDGIPYPIFAYCGLLPWQLFVHTLTESANSMVANRQLITKVYFPRLILPLSSILVGLVDFAIALLVLLGLMLYYRIAPTAAALWLPFFVALTMLTALSAGLWLAALNVRYRDIRYTIPFLTQLWLFATPIVYPASLLPERWRLIYGLNPMAGVVEAFRWALLGRADGPPGALLAVSVGITLAVLVGGLYYFRRMEQRFADLI